MRRQIVIGLIFVLMYIIPLSGGYAKPRLILGMGWDLVSHDEVEMTILVNGHIWFPDSIMQADIEITIPPEISLLKPELQFIKNIYPNINNSFGMELKIEDDGVFEVEVRCKKKSQVSKNTPEGIDYCGFFIIQRKNGELRYSGVSGAPTLYKPVDHSISIGISSNPTIEESVRELNIHMFKMIGDSNVWVRKDQDGSLSTEKRLIERHRSRRCKYDKKEQYQAKDICEYLYITEHGHFVRETRIYFFYPCESNEIWWVTGNLGLLENYTSDIEDDHDRAYTRLSGLRSEVNRGNHPYGVDRTFVVHRVRVIRKRNNADCIR